MLLDDDVEALEEVVEEGLTAAKVVVSGLFHEEVVFQGFEIHDQSYRFRVDLRIYEVALRQHLTEQVDEGQIVLLTSG